MAEQLDYETLDAIFANYGETAKFDTEKRWQQLLHDPIEREKAQRWLQVNDPTYRTIWLRAVDEGFRHHLEVNEVMLLLYSRHMKQR